MYAFRAFVHLLMCACSWQELIGALVSLRVLSMQMRSFQSNAYTQAYQTYHCGSVPLVAPLLIRLEAESAPVKQSSGRRLVKGELRHSRVRNVCFSDRLLCVFKRHLLCHRHRWQHQPFHQQAWRQQTHCATSCLTWPGGLQSKSE